MNSSHQMALPGTLQSKADIKLSKRSLEKLELVCFTKSMLSQVSQESLFANGTYWYSTDVSW